jgi:hypothetical protein
MWRDYYDNEDTFCECEINGVRIPYDCCSSNSKKEAFEVYKNHEYIGSNNGVIYVNGVRNDFKQEYHFFIYSNLKKNRRKKLEKLKEIE